MYTWGYIKSVALAKLDLGQQEANSQNLLSRFCYYANEVITQICSSIKPNHTFVQFVISDDDVKNNVVKTMPSDFVSFGDDVCTISENGVIREAFDDDYLYYGYNKLLFLKSGTFNISYDARWLVFNDSIKDDDYLDIPYDILDCIPSYIASQCYKIDDEYKSTVFRNEYEMFLARINDNNYKQTKTFKISGGW